MRVQLVGSYSIDELKEAFSVILEDLQSSNFDSAKTVNIYLKPCINGKATPLLDDGYEIEHMVYDLKRKRKVAYLSD